MSQVSIAIVNYQAGNLRSVQKALERYGARALITNNVRDIEVADALVFPGQGASDSSMVQLRENNLIEPIVKYIGSGKPFLGVCLALQLLLEESEEGQEPGLGIIAGRVRKIPDGVKVPHMGWNRVKIHTTHPVLSDIPSESYFYFVHSYYAEPEDQNLVAATTHYGIEFCSVVAWDNVIATQFHPEKSGRIGLKIYQNFVELVEKTRTVGTWKSSQL